MRDEALTDAWTSTGTFSPCAHAWRCMARFVVVGGGAAGMSAASVAKRRDPDLEVLVLEAGEHISFSACGMPYWIGGTIEGDADRLVVRSPEEARERGLDVRLGTRAVDVDPEDERLVVEDADGRRGLGYDALCLAPGVAAVNPFDEMAGVHTLRHLDDGIRLDRAIEADAPERVCIVGGGFVGVEMAEAACQRGWETTLVHSGETLLGDLVGAELGQHVNEAVRGHGVELVLGARATGLVGEDRVEAVEVGDRHVGADLVVLAIGARPRTELAQAAGCTLGPAGTIRVDKQMRTGVDGVWACGDAVAFEHRLTGEPTFLPLALHANRSGRIVGENVAGGQERFPGVLGTAVTRFEELEVAGTGLDLEAAREAGFDAVAETISSVTRAGYFPGADEIHVRLVVEEDTGRVLGGQIVGGEGAGKRIDTVAAAIWQGATASDLEAMDLSYAPPFSPTWDPVAIAGRMAARAAGGSA